jgi:hypothetical protein
MNGSLRPSLASPLGDLLCPGSNLRAPAGSLGDSRASVRMPLAPSDGLTAAQVADSAVRVTRPRSSTISSGMAIMAPARPLDLQPQADHQPGQG